MSNDHHDRYDHIWQHLRRVIFDAVHAILGPPPPDVAEKIEDVLREAERDWEEGKECQDEADETPWRNGRPPA